jgi:putative endonuclease
MRRRARTVTATAQERGFRGEELAARFLQTRGLEILGRNVRIGSQEVDLIAREGTVLVFVEVKTACGPTYGPPESWITPGKRKRLVRAAQRYLIEHGLEDVDCRFDVIAIERRGRSVTLRHLKDAFFPEPGDLSD